MTGGQFKGRKVESPENTRPTLSKVRESVFNVLHSHMQSFCGLNFLDMFCASAIMSIEAASRGFSVVAVEKNPSVAKCAKKNCESLGAGVKIITADALRVVSKLDGEFDVIYIDPPWKYDYSLIIKIGMQKLSPNGLLICESDNKKIQPTLELPQGVRLYKEKFYGRCKISFFVKAQSVYINGDETYDSCESELSDE